MSAAQTESQTLTPQRNSFGARIIALADHLAQWSESLHGLTCTYLSPAHRAVAAEIAGLMERAGLIVTTDAVGNVVGRYKSHNDAAKTVIIGSHYDTVTNAGKYDGRLGILTGLVVAENFITEGRQLPFNLDVIAFSEEEGVRFSTAYLGSGAIAGRFDPNNLDRRDAKGISLADALREAKLDFGAIPTVARRMEEIAAYLEVHIEQGPVLLQSGLPVGVVTAIAGATRFKIVIEGVAGHAGAVPMAYRHDAAAAAAEVVLYVEKRCNQADLVGTVGQLVVPDGAINVIAGRCELSLDIRSSNDKTRNAAVNDILVKIQEIASKRGVTINVTELHRTSAVLCSPLIQDAFAQSIERLGLPVVKMLSGAGHDAVIFDGLTDIGMLFVRCGNGGVSHSPLETISAADADLAARILLDVLGQFKPKAA